VQTTLRRNGAVASPSVPNRFALSQGLLRCTALRLCHDAGLRNAARNQRYRYYLCGTAQKRGWSACPSKSIPAAEIERFVVEGITGIADNAPLLQAALDHADADRDAGMLPGDVPIDPAPRSRASPRFEEWQRWPSRCPHSESFGIRCLLKRRPV